MPLPISPMEKNRPTGAPTPMPVASLSPKTLWIVNFLDHFDLALYMSLAPLWGQLFSAASHTTLEKSFWFHSVTFLISAVSYPLGTFIFGYVAQKKSPLMGLRWSIWGFSLSTLAMGMTPTLSQYPLLGPWLFCAFRFFQCFFARGERTITPLYLMAHSTQKTALDRAVAYDVILISGQWCAQIVAFFLLQSGHLFLWRIPFLIAGVFGCCTAWVRCKAIPTHPISASPLPAQQSQRPSWQWFAALACMTGPSYIFYALTFYLMTDFVPMITPLSVTALAGQKIYLSAIDILVLLMAHHVLKRYTQRSASLLPIMRLLCLASIAILPLVFWGLPLWPSLHYVGCVRILLIIIGVTYSLCFFVSMRQAIPATHKPYVFISIAHLLGNILLGQSTSTISLWMYGCTQWSCAPGLYGAVVCALALWGQSYFQTSILRLPSSDA